ncbi:hypothetical protein LWI28_027524 [Acer negundo]|uniref:Uncharacterized protein n=1 Tax=Acer negundo TaxID=4023 RepID=A0AAD5P4W3_ACENE|nr:hypothetical protein LWI28_027524 [Acer negundo]
MAGFNGEDGQNMIGFTVGGGRWRKKRTGDNRWSRSASPELRSWRRKFEKKKKKSGEASGPDRRGQSSGLKGGNHRRRRRMKTQPEVLEASRNLQEEIAKVIKAGKILCFDFNGRENDMVEKIVMRIKAGTFGQLEGIMLSNNK